MGLYQLGGLFLIKNQDCIDYGFGFHIYRNFGLRLLTHKVIKC
jgi:hypothetical protein